MADDDIVERAAAAAFEYSAAAADAQQQLVLAAEFICHLYANVYRLQSAGYDDHEILEVYNQLIDIAALEAASSRLDDSPPPHRNGGYGVVPVSVAAVDEQDHEGLEDWINQAIAVGRLRVTIVQAATSIDSDEAYLDGGFGGVPASAAAIAGLETQKYDASRDDEGCVICFVDYEADDELSVMPCMQRHRFHQKCLAKWLARSHLCPLCRHALPTEEQDVP